MPQTVVLPRQVALISGVVEAGSVLRFYRTETTTPQAVYTDSALTNPVTSATADAAGVFQKLYLNPSSGFDYRITLENAAGVVSYTEDDISRGLTAEDLESLLTQALLAPLMNPRTSAETTALVTPSNYAVPSHDQVGSILVGRYGFSTSATAAVNLGALQDAHAVKVALGRGVIRLPPGAHSLASEWTISSDDTQVFFDDTLITFDPASTAVCINFDGGGTSLERVGVDGRVQFRSTNSVNKTAIRFEDCRDFYCRGVTIGSADWLGSGSIGVHTLGRDTADICKLHILCARPVVIDKNPNHATLDCDHFHIHDYEIGSTLAAGINLEFVDGVHLTNLTIDGYGASVLGAYGISWNDTLSTIDSYNVTIKGMRTEQGSDATGYSIRLASTAQDLKALLIEQCNFDSGRNGVYLRKPECVSIRNCFFTGGTGRTNLDITFQSKTALDIEGTEIAAASTVTLTNAAQFWGAPQNSGVEIIPKTASYRYDEGALVSRKSRREDGVLSFKYKGTLADDAQLNLPVLSSGGADLATFQVSMGAATGPVLEYAFGAWRPGTVALTGSTNTATSSSDGDLCVIDNTNALSVINRLGLTVDVVISVTWSD